MTSKNHTAVSTVAIHGLIKILMFIRNQDYFFITLGHVFYVLSEKKLITIFSVSTLVSLITQFVLHKSAKCQLTDKQFLAQNYLYVGCEYKKLFRV